jgi:DNA-binding transcriptional MocR family regulator
MVVPDAILNEVVTVRSVTGRSNSIVEQLALARYINEGDFARHLRASRDQYMRRRDLLLAELRKALGGKLKVTGEQAIADALVDANRISLIPPEIAPRDGSPARHSLPASSGSFEQQ